MLKYPKHLLSLDALLAKYPDAILIWTHRDSAEVLPSAVSLTGFMRAANTPAFDPIRFARELVTIEELALHRGLVARDRDGKNDRNIDLDYGEIMRDPVGTIEAVCERIGVSFGDVSRRRVRQWL